MPSVSKVIIILIIIRLREFAQAQNVIALIPTVLNFTEITSWARFELTYPIIFECYQLSVFENTIKHRIAPYLNFFRRISAFPCLHLNESSSIFGLIYLSCIIISQKKKKILFIYQDVLMHSLPYGLTNV